MISIIGDRGNRKSNYNPNLADIVNKQVEAEERKRKLEEARRGKAGGKPTEEPPAPDVPSVVTPPIISAGDYITLTDIVCKDAQRKPFEQYDSLQFAKNVPLRADGSHVPHTIYDWIVYHEQQGLFLPSFALLCNIAVRLEQNALEKKAKGTFAVKDAELEQVLSQFNKYGKVAYGWHAGNTLVDYARGRIIHYPRKEDFTSDGGSVDINLAQTRRKFPFQRNLLGGSDLLENVLAEKGERLAFAKNLSGLDEAELRVLCKLGEDFGRSAILWCAPDKDEVRGCWLGSGSISTYLYLGADECLYGIDASRGVRRGSAEGGAEGRT